MAGVGVGGGMGPGGVPAHTITSDTVPLGEVDVRRGDPVHATAKKEVQDLPAVDIDHPDRTPGS
jgi:hypothetical protein